MTEATLVTERDRERVVKEMKLCFVLREICARYLFGAYSHIPAALNKTTLILRSSRFYYSSTKLTKIPRAPSSSTTMTNPLFLSPLNLPSTPFLNAQLSSLTSRAPQKRCYQPPLRSRANLWRMSKPENVSGAQLEEAVKTCKSPMLIDVYAQWVSYQNNTTFLTFNYILISQPT